ncbi:MAG: hypothetical protein IJM14_02890 [Lachnospiraceae bacterium]|nr:hypothetical protein [Lachnospiraceae bacterium]
MSNVKNIYKNLAVYILIFVFIAVTIQIDSGDWGQQRVSLILYGIFLCIWFDMTRRRLLRPEISRLFLMLEVMLILFLFVQYAKYVMPGSKELLTRMLWYIYYIPMTFSLLICFYITLYIGNTEKTNVLGRWKLLAIPACFLSLLYLTNEKHQLLFKFSKDFANWENDYKRGPVYILFLLWTAFLSISFFIVLFSRSRSLKVRKLIYIPMIPVAIGMVYLSLLLIGKAPKINGREVIFFQQVYGFIIVGLWEFAIEVGLLPSNTYYEEIFENSLISAYLVNKNGEPVLGKSRAKIKPDEDHVLRTNKIHGGKICWVDDISGINRLKAEIMEKKERLSEEGTILEAENRLKEERSAIATKKKLYEQTFGMLEGKIETIESLLENERAADYDIRLAIALVMTAYVKRRSNLELMTASGNGKVSFNELVLCMTESVEYAGLLLPGATFEYAGNDELYLSEVKKIYEWFEGQLESMIRKPGPLVVSLWLDEKKIYIRFDRSSGETKKGAFAVSERSFNREVRT